MREHEIASILSEYIYNSCQDIVEYNKFRTLVKATGIVSRKISYFEI